MRVCRTLAASLLALAVCACSEPAPVAANPTPVIGPADDQTMTIVTAAQAYVASLSPAQMTASLFAFNDAAQRARWSNLAAGGFERRGVKWADLNDTQRARLSDLLNAVLSDDGVRMIGAQMAADDYLRDNPDAATPDLAPPPAAPEAPPAPSAPLFGSGEYYVAFLGAPSVTAPWTLQIGGHHLAINATVVGPHMTLAPSLTGGQPARFGKNGETFHGVQAEVTAAQALIDSLSPDLREQAVVGGQTPDLLLGPGRDGYTLSAEGLQAKAMTADQKAKLLKLVETRIGLMNANDAAAAMTKIRADIDKTWFAWFGPTADAGRAYFRVTGPTLHMEFAPQDAPAGNHVHAIYRDPTNDYGRAWASIK